MVGFPVFCKSLSISRSWLQKLAIKKEEEEKGRERKGNHRWQSYMWVLQRNQDRNRENHALCDTIFPWWNKGDMSLLLRSPLLSSFFLLFLGSHFPFLSHPLFFSLDIFPFILSSINFPCSLVHFKSNLFAVIQRISVLLRYYPETPKLLQTLSAPELKEI